MPSGGHLLTLVAALPYIVEVLTASVIKFNASFQTQLYIYIGPCISYANSRGILYKKYIIYIDKSTAIYIYKSTAITSKVCHHEYIKILPVVGMCTQMSTIY